MTNLNLFGYTFTAMGSPCKIQIYAENQPEAKHIADVAVADVQRLEQRYSRYRNASLLAEINRVAATGGRIFVDDETAGLINYADTCYRESDGLFDITSGILRDAWHFDQKALPDPRQIEALLDRIGWHKVRWEPPYLEFPSGMEIDFGGIVKEYAVDRATLLCRNAGVHHGIINLGGDIRIIGPHPDGGAWHIGIQHPEKKELAIATIALRYGGVASSGNYDRCIVLDGVRYGHVLNPKTGWPVQHLASVSVVSELSIVAGSASTIAMLKEEDGPAWLDSMGLPYYWVDVNGKVGGSLV
jgi:thiamine biosynthesis lipoprotein